MPSRSARPEYRRPGTKTKLDGRSRTRRSAMAWHTARVYVNTETDPPPPNLNRTHGMVNPILKQRASDLENIMISPWFNFRVRDQSKCLLRVLLGAAGGSCTVEDREKMDEVVEFMENKIVLWTKQHWNSHCFCL